MVCVWCAHGGALWSIAANKTKGERCACFSKPHPHPHPFVTIVLQLMQAIDSTRALETTLSALIVTQTCNTRLHQDCASLVNLRDLMLQTLSKTPQHTTCHIQPAQCTLRTRCTRTTPATCHLVHQRKQSPSPCPPLRWMPTHSSPKQHTKQQVTIAQALWLHIASTRYDIGGYGHHRPSPYHSRLASTQHIRLLLHSALLHAYWH